MEVYMVRSVGGPSNNPNVHHPQSATRGQGPKASEGVLSLASRIGNIVKNGNISPAGKHVFTRKAPDESLKRDVERIVKSPLNLVGQFFKKCKR